MIPSLPALPILPSFDGVRLATPDDLGRIATVAAAGFFHSPTFQFQRIHHQTHADDTLLSYWTEYHSAILDPATVVLVAEDWVHHSEGDHVYPALRKAVTYSPGARAVGSKAVVGVASVAIKPGSPYIGLFQPTGSAFQPASSHVPPNSNRDMCEDRVRIYDQATSPAKKSCYWGHGHATRLVGWCTRLADLDGVSVGISAVPQGAVIAARAGFEERELVRIERTCMRDQDAQTKENTAAEVELWVAIRRPSGSPASGDSATSSDSQ